MNEMYQIQFAENQPFRNMVKFLKKNKARPGKYVTLLEAEKVIKLYHLRHNVSGTVVVTLDSEGSDYTYDFSLRLEENQPFELLEAFEEVLEKDGGSDRAVKIRNELATTYQMEQNPPQKVGFMKKLFGLKKKEQEESSGVSDEVELATTSPDIDDFADQTKFDNQVMDQELEDLDKEMEELDEEEEEENDEFEDDDLFGKPEDVVPQVEIQKDSKEEDKKVETQLPKSEISFMNYDHYLSFQEVEKKIERYDERFKQEYLLGLLGLGEETEMTPLKLRQVQYAKRILNSQTFMLIQDRYYREVEDATYEKRLYLEQEYKNAIMMDYEKEAESELEPVFDSLFQQMAIKVNQYKDREEKEIQQKLEALQEKQRLELDAFKLEQETKYQAFSSELENRKHTLVQSNRDVLQKEVDLQKKQAVSDKIYELKRNTQTNLVDKRNATLTQHADTIELLMNRAFESQQKVLKEVAEKIEKETPNWIQEIQNEREAELYDKELMIKQKAISLEEKKLLKNTEGRVTEKDAQIADLQEKLKKSNRKIEELEMNKQPNMGFYPVYSQPMYHPPQPNMYMPVQQPVSGEIGTPSTEKKRRGFKAWLFG